MGSLFPHNGLVEFDVVLLRLGLALLLGAGIGIDRQIRHKPAGLRTMMLVCLGAAAFALIAQMYLSPGGETMKPADASRVIQGIVGGIGFLGVGVIIHNGTHTAGITTAATIWVTAAVGVAIGSGLYGLGVAAGVVAILTLTLVGLLERFIPGDTDEQPEAMGEQPKDRRNPAPKD